MSVTLREIAEITGLSRMAVSLALRGKPGVSKANRKRVLKVAEDLGYRPDPERAKLMARLRAQTSGETAACMAMLTSGTGRDAWNRTVTERKYVEGAEARAKEFGYRLERFWIHEPGMSMKRMGDILWNRGIDGVILAPLLGLGSVDASRRVDLDYDRFSVVEISETIEWPDLDRALHDQFTSMLTLLARLEKLGYQRPGLVLDRALDRRVNGKWTAAYLRHRAEARHPGAPPLLLEGMDGTKFKAWLKRHQPDALISVAGFGARLADTLGLDILGDIAYASLDVDGSTKWVEDASGIDQNSLRVGAAAVDLLTGMIQRGQCGLPIPPVRTQVEGHWVEGSSAPPV